MTLLPSTSTFHSLLACLALSIATGAVAQTPGKGKVSVPPSAELSYKITAKQKGLALDGAAKVKWAVEQGKYALSTETRALLLGKILEARSEGLVTATGLVPLTSTEKRMHKEPNTATFNRETKTISFSASDKTYPIKGGEQDRNSAVWQLASMVRGAQGKVKPGTEWTFFVAGQKDGEDWTFKVNRQEKIALPSGTVSALHVTRIIKAEADAEKIDIWLAPSMDWYPVRIRFTESNGDFIEQTLDKVTKN